MYIETIRLQQGEFRLLPLHIARLNATRSEAYGCAPMPEEFIRRSLNEAIASQPDAGNGIWKVRILYDRELQKIEAEPYRPRPVNSLRLVESDSIDYHLKKADRSQLASLASMKGDCDEVIIIRRGLVTDTSYSNLLFVSGSGLLTPSQPLLPGVMRRYLIDSGLVKEYPLTPADILPGNRLGITEAIMINAMLPPGSVVPISVEALSTD